MSPRLFASLRYWTEYLAGVTLVYIGIHVLGAGDLTGLVPLILGIALILINFSETKGRRARARAEERVPVPAIQDDGSLH